MICKVGTSLTEMQEEVNMKMMTTLKDRIIQETEMI